MKTFVLLCLIPCQIFCCQDCIEKIQEKIDWTACEIIREVNKAGECDALYFNYLFGQYDAYWECLRLIQHQGS